jgi:NADH-quinone oxidoreductase subunit C
MMSGVFQGIERMGRSRVGTSDLIDKVKGIFPGSIREVKTFRDETTLVVEKEKMAEVFAFLRKDPDLSFDYLTDLCGVDYGPRRPRFEVVYHLCSTKYDRRLRVKIPLEEGESLASVESIWKAANWYEREAYDMLGISFENHPDLRRILTSDGFEGHPLRKDFPVKGKDFDKPFVPEL